MPPWERWSRKCEEVEIRRREERRRRGEEEEVEFCRRGERWRRGEEEKVFEGRSLLQAQIKESL